VGHPWTFTLLYSGVSERCMNHHRPSRNISKSTDPCMSRYFTTA